MAAALWTGLCLSVLRGQPPGLARLTAGPPPARMSLSVLRGQPLGHARMTAGPPPARMSAACGPREAVAHLWSTVAGSESAVLFGDSQAESTTLGVRISRDSTITKLWTRDDWSKHMDAYRFWRHLIFWPRSTVVRSLLPLLLGLAAWTSVVFAGKLSLPISALALSVSPLALLLAFRVNAATARFSDARTLWGRAVLHARDAASIIATMGHLPPATRDACCALLCSFGWALKAVLRSDDSLRPVLSALLPPATAEWVGGRRKPPLAIVSLVRQLTADAQAPLAAAQSLSTCLSGLNGAYGGMERIFSTPLSPTYMRHTTRGLLLWLGMLPAGLYGAGVPFARALLSVCATGYIMLGIEVRPHARAAPPAADPRPAARGLTGRCAAARRASAVQEIGIQIEQPFDCLPLHGLCAVLTMDVLDELCPEAPIPAAVLRCS